LFVVYPISAAEQEKEQELPALDGELEGTIEKQETPYLVTGEIVVPPGETVFIEPGVIFLFKNFTGLLVQGTLLARGTSDEPIVFTSENDWAYNGRLTIEPAPYDWNGITIYDNTSGTVFRHCKVQYTLFGINALTEQVLIDSCYFQQNGKSDVVIAGETLEVGDDAFSYGVKAAAGDVPETAVVEPTDTTAQTIDSVDTPGSPKKSRGKATTVIMQEGGVSLFAAGCALAAWKGAELSGSQRRLDALSDPDEHKLKPDIQEQWDTAKKERDADLYQAGAGLGAAVLGIGLFVASLFL
jgi:hypothetical protein